MRQNRDELISDITLMTKKNKILIVDDVESIRTSIRKHLAKEFEVREAANANEAIEICKSEKMELVITDIRMPDISGIDMIRILRKTNPDTKYTLMTAYNIDDYVSLLSQEKIWNIIPKSAFLDLNYLLILSRKLLCKNPFGVHYYFPQVKVKRIAISEIHRMHKAIAKKKLRQGNIYICNIKTPEENKSIGTKVSEILLANNVPLDINQVLEELCANALNYTYDKKGFDLGFGIFEGCTALSVMDYDGSLDRKQILLALERQIKINPETGLPIGIIDTHGRGLHIVREQSSHLIFNIDPGKRTEIICIVSNNPIQRIRAISIFQKEKK